MTASAHTHPLVVAYLTDLEHALAGADPQEREDTLAAIREHIEDALDGAPQDAEAAATVLDSLGPVERIAATATPAPEASAPTSRSWAAPTLLGCAVVSFAVVFAMPWVATPLAVGALVGSLIQLRRGVGRPGFLRTSVVISAVTLVIAAFMAAFLLSETPGVDNPDDVQTIESHAS